MGAPQATVEGSVPGQRGSHTQRRSSGSQRSVSPQPPRQRPPQPSSAPQAAVAGQEGTHVQVLVAGSHDSPAREHEPGQRPPQPSSAPQGASGEQSGAHTQAPKTQRSLRPRLHGGEHWQESRQRPLTQTEPSAQVTAAQGLSRQAPSTQYCVAAQTTPSQAVRGKHWRWQAWPSGQGAEQRRRAVHSPLPGSQNCPPGQTTPTHGVGKQPGTQRPSMQVSRAAQATPAQGSRTATHWAKQVAVSPQVFSVEHGSAAQRPPMQRVPAGQKRSSGQRWPVSGGGGRSSRLGTSTAWMSGYIPASRSSKPASGTGIAR